MKDFEKASSSKLNLSKCWGIWLGSWKNREDTPFEINWTNKLHKICGIMLGNGDVLSANWGNILNKLEKRTNLLLQRHLSFYAKANLFEVVLCSNFLSISLKKREVNFFFLNSKPTSKQRYYVTKF